MPDRRSPLKGEPIGALIRRHRRALGLSQTALARLLCESSGHASMNQSRISDYECGRHVPQLWLCHFSTVLRVPLDDLEFAALLTSFHQHRHDRYRRAAPSGPITR